MAIYKYVTQERVDVFKNGCIRFSQPAALNDPWEGHPNFQKLICQENLETVIIPKVLEQTTDKEVLNDVIAKVKKNFEELGLKITDSQLSLAVNQFISQTGKSLQQLRYEAMQEALDMFKQAEPDVIESIPNIINDKFGVLSLTTNPSNELMWSHYANSHAGMVIEFDPNHEFFASPQGFTEELHGLHQVVYADSPPPIVDIFALEHVGWAPMILIKSRCWVYEEEFRAIRPLKMADKIIDVGDHPIHLYNVPPDCFKGVVFGSKMKPDVRSSIREEVKSTGLYDHLHWSEAIGDSRSFQIQISRIL